MKNKKFKKYHLFGLLGLLSILTVIRLAIPGIIRSRVNQSLKGAGHVEDVRLSFWRGACQLEGLSFPSKDKGVQDLIFYCRKIDIGLQWSALGQGRISVAVTWTDPQVNFFAVAGDVKAGETAGPDWSDAVRGLVVIEIDRLEVKNGEIHFRDPGKAPQLDLTLHQLSIVADNLSGRQKGLVKIPGTVTASGRVMKNGLFSMHAQIDPQAKDPAFEVSAKLEGLKLGDLNPYFRRYLGFSVREGNLDVTGEAAGADGSFKGSVSPHISGLVFEKQKGAASISKYLKRTAAGILGGIFASPRKQGAPRLTYQGRFTRPGTNLWQAAVSLFENALVVTMPSRRDGKAAVQDLDRKAPEK